MKGDPLNKAKEFEKQAFTISSHRFLI